MNDQSDALTITEAGNLLQAVRDRINDLLLGQAAVVDQVLVALLSNGHVLLEGVPGLGKTLLVRTLAGALDSRFSHVELYSQEYLKNFTHYLRKFIGKGTHHASNYRHQLVCRMRQKSD